jgi:protein-disulfide isomerase
VPRPAPTPRRSLKPFYILLGLVLAAGILVFATQFIRGKGEGANQGVAVTLSPDELQRVKGISLGRDDAPITIYEFADFQCPHCAEFVWKVEPLIRDSLVNTGKVRYVFYEFPVGFKWSVLSARSGRCAQEQGKFWPYHDLLYARQSEWAFEKDPAALFAQYARQVGLDAGKFESCVRSNQYVKEVSESSQLGQSLGVQGTPTIFVNGRKMDTPSNYRDFENQVRSMAPSAFGAAPAAAPAAGAPAAPSADSAKAGAPAGTS